MSDLMECIDNQLLMHFEPLCHKKEGRGVWPIKEGQVLLHCCVHQIYIVIDSCGQRRLLNSAATLLT